MDLKPSAISHQPSGMSPWSIQEHFSALERDQPIADHLLEVGHEGLNLVRRVHDLDDDWQILRELQQLCGVDAAVRAEAHESLHDGGAGQPALARFEHDRFIERLAVPAIRLAAEVPQQLAFSW